MQVNVCVTYYDMLNYVFCDTQFDYDVYNIYGQLYVWSIYSGT